MMLWIIIGIALLFAVAFLLLMRNNNDEATTASDTEAAPDPVEDRENAIVALQTKASLLGLPGKTNINALIDKCIDVHEALASVDPQENAQLHSVPGDFTRLIGKHLPDLISKFGQISANASESDITEFNDLLAQLNDELDDILKNISERNYTAFASKHGFMKIRYSDKF